MNFLPSSTAEPLQKHILAANERKEAKNAGNCGERKIRKWIVDHLIKNT